MLADRPTPNKGRAGATNTPPTAREHPPATPPTRRLRVDVRPPTGVRQSAAAPPRSRPRDTGHAHAQPRAADAAYASRAPAYISSISAPYSRSTTGRLSLRLGVNSPCSMSRSRGSSRNFLIVCQRWSPSLSCCT